MPDKAELIQEILHSLRRLFQVVNEHSKRAERQTGLTGPQLWAIKILHQEQPLMVSEIAARMYLHPATVVGILDRLEKQGIVLRMRALDDRRVVRVELTEDGQTLLKKSPQVAQGLLVSGLEKLASKDLDNISFGLIQMVTILGAQKIPPRLMISTETSGKKGKSGTARQSTAVRRIAGGGHERDNYGAGIRI
jgi:DNA-binding MarR family transcriptional regulator